MGHLLRPHQMGYGSRSGAETIVHATRSYLETTPKCLVVKVDFRNAFNSHHRAPMLREVQTHAPELFNLAHYSYAKPSPLFFGSRRISSESGCQQGDPCAPLFFSLLLQPVLKNLKSSLAVSYLDDLTLADPNPNIIAADLQLIKEAFQTTGLVMNNDKCEVFYQGFPSEEQLNAESIIYAASPGMVSTNSETLELLGAAVLPQAIPSLMEKMATRFSRIQYRLPLISSQAALFLLRHSMGAQRFMYFIRACPAFTKLEALKKVDNIMQRCVELCLNIAIQGPSLAQLRLPIAEGGLGLRSISELALPAFLSSVYGCKEDIKSILRAETEVAHLQMALSAWQTDFNERPEDGQDQKQSAWDKISVAKAKSLLINELSTSPQDHTRFAHAASAHSGAWLLVRPDDNLGTTLQDAEFRTACCLRLGIDVCTEQTCPCGSIADTKGYHFLSCKEGASMRQARHAAVNEVVVRATRQCGVLVRVEPTNLCSDNAIRPDGITLTPWTMGRKLLWDVTVRNTYAESYTNLARTVGGVAAKAERDKRHHYRVLENQYFILPFVVETSGVWGTEALDFSREIGIRLKQQTGDTRHAGFFRQRIALEVQRGGAQIILSAIAAGGGSWT